MGDGYIGPRPSSSLPRVPWGALSLGLAERGGDGHGWPGLAFPWCNPAYLQSMKPGKGSLGKKVPTCTPGSPPSLGIRGNIIHFAMHA